jgi:hypothetical protein
VRIEDRHHATSHGKFRGESAVCLIYCFRFRSCEGTRNIKSLKRFPCYIIVIFVQLVARSYTHNR